MKKVALLVAAAAIATSTAYAAPIKKAAITAKKAAAATKTTAARVTTKEEQKKKQSKKAKSSPVAPTAAAAQKEISPQVEPAIRPSTGGQSATPAANAKPAAAKKRFSGLLYDRASVNMNSTNRQQEDTTASGEMVARIGYKVTDTTSISLGTDIEHSYGNDPAGDGTSKATWVIYDMYLMAAKSDLGTLPGDVKTKGYLRFYLPTSEGSQEAGQIGRLRGQLNLSKALGKFTATYIAEPNYYIQDSADYRAAKTEYKSPNGVTATRSFRFLHYGMLSYDATAKLGFYTLLGVDHGWFNKPTDPNNIVEKNASETEALVAETGASYSITGNISLGAGITQYGPNLLAQKANQEGPLYRDELTSYFLEGTLTF